MKSNQRGFSLVELAIVLVILGLLTGGILSGQSLIRASQLRSYTVEAQQMAAAMNAFRDKYLGLPGDLYNATSFWTSLGGDGTNAACQNLEASGLPTCNGNGDNWIDYVSVSGDERFRFWQHLSNAGLISGRYTGRTDSGTAGSFVLTRGKNVPNYKADATATVVARFAVSTTSGSFPFLNSPTGNYLEFRGAATGTFLSPEEQWNMDTKMDDGKPATGAFQGPQSTWSACTTSDDPATAVYDLANTNKVCRFNYRL